MLIKLCPFGLRPLAIILMMAMIAFAWVADAAACGSEIAPPVAFQVAEGAGLQVDTAENDTDEGGSPVDQHGVCAHGHCHHGSNVVESPRFERLKYQVAVPYPANYGKLPSANPDLLMRPPQA